MVSVAPLPSCVRALSRSRHSSLSLHLAPGVVGLRGREVIMAHTHPHRERIFAGPKALPNAADFRLYLGMNAGRSDVYWSFINQTLLLIGGKVGMGKSQAVHEWISQLAVHPWVQVVIIDGKDGHTYTAWKDRCWMMSGNDLGEVIRVLKKIQGYIRKRADAYYEEFGKYNIWDARADGLGGPTAKYPLILVVWEEAQVFLSQATSKEFGLRGREAQVAEIFEMALALVNMGRDSGVLNFMATQKPTTDAIPSLISNQAGTGACFGVTSIHAAVPVLTEGIRDPKAAQFSPVGKVGEQDRGVATVLVPSPSGVPFDRVRVPYPPAEYIRETVESCKGLVRDPYSLLYAA